MMISSIMIAAAAGSFVVVAAAIGIAFGGGVLLGKFLWKK